MEQLRRLGRYELLEALGEGGMGAVWLARLTGTHGFEKLCIVKTVLPSLAKEKAFVSRFLHEGRLLTQLQHSNIAQVLDMGDEGGTLFLALEYVAGIDLARLHEHVRGQGQLLPVPVSVYLVQQAAEGLGAAHRKAAVDGTPLHIVHRDVSPQNLMVSYEGEVKVIDFGVAKSEARSHHTATPSVMGKLGYMAPEQALAEAVDHRADQYALGIVLWELLSNRPFIERGTLTEMVVAMAKPTLRPLSPLRPEVPPSLEQVVLRALSVDPAQRFPTTDAFARALMDELVLLSGMPSKVQIGEFVKSHCSAEYASTQALLTRASVLRSAPADASAPTQPMTASTIEPTMVSNPALRSVARATPAAPSQEPPMSTAQLQAAALPPSKAPLVAGAALIAALAALGGWTLLSGRSPAEAPKGGSAGPSAALKPALEPAPAGSGKDDGSKPPEPPKEPAPALVPPVADVVQAAPGDVVESKAVAELFVDGSKTYVRAGQGDGLVVGSTLVIVGSPQPDGKRAQLGTGTVMEVFPKMARVALDDAAGKATGARFAALGDVKVTAAAAGAGPVPVEVKKAVDLFTDADKTYARAGQPEGLVVGQTVTIVSGPQADGRRLKLGTGTVMEVFPKMARLALDAQAAKTGGDRFVALGEVKVLATVGDTLEVKRAAEVFADGDKTYARAGQPEGLVPGQELFVVGAPLADGRRTKLGKATVMEVQGKLARLLLDADAGKAASPRFVSLDVGGGGSTAQGAAVVGPAAGRPSGGRGPMTGKLKLQTAPVWSVFLENTSSFGWSGCTLVAPGQRRYAFPSLGSGARREFPVNFFVFDPTAPQLGNEVVVNCKEGSLRIPSM